jgi:hydrogenase/urease accessory protein HupE
MKTGGLVFVFLLIVAVSVLLYVSQDYHSLAKKLPQLVGGVTLILLLWEFGIGLWKKKRQADEKKESVKDMPSPFVIKRWLTLGISLLVYVILLPRIGFLIMTSLLLVSMLWFFNVRRPLTVIIYTGVIVGVIYGVFARLLYVPLPAGTWW